MPTLDDFAAIKLGSTDIQSICLGSEEIWSANKVNEPLKFSVESGTATVAMTTSGSPTPASLQYSRDKNTWSSWDLSALEISASSPLYIKGNNPNGLNDISNRYKFVITGAKVWCDGNVMSLLGEDVRDIPCAGCFYSLFDSCETLVSAPSLPATTLAPNCYAYMFRDCVSLANAPELPATDMAKHCYKNMFTRCSALITAPDLNAVTLEAYCYYYMFSYCTKLSSVKCLATEGLTNGSIEYWLQNVASSGVCVKAKGAALTGIPEGWTIIEV